MVVLSSMKIISTYTYVSGRDRISRFLWRLGIPRRIPIQVEGTFVTQSNIEASLIGKTIRGVVVVPGKLVNILVS